MSQPTDSSPQHSQNKYGYLTQAEDGGWRWGWGHNIELLIPQWQCNVHPISAQPPNTRASPLKHGCGTG